MLRKCSTFQQIIKQFHLTTCLSSTSAQFRVHLEQDNLQVIKQSNDGTSSIDVNYVWLRDHCNCSLCHNSATNQRRLEPFDIFMNIKPLAAEITNNRADEVSASDSELQINWPQDHQSRYPLSWLWKVWTPRDNGARIRSRTRHRKNFWDAGKLQEMGGVPTLAFDAISKDTEHQTGLKNLIKNILVHGACIVSDVPYDSPDATLELSQKVGLIQKTVYGGFWIVDPSDDAKEFHPDTAYTSEAIGPHTDGTYYKNSPGLQIFHVTSAAKEGGETVLVDGFHAVNRLQHVNPSAFRVLSDLPIAHHYLESGVAHLRCEEPVIALSRQSGEVFQLRYNPLDRAPLDSLSQAQCVDFYGAYRALSSIIKEPAMQFWTRLTRGQVLFVDNWRLLHGRSAFKGRRAFCGCYIARDDFLSRARTLRLF